MTSAQAVRALLDGMSVTGKDPELKRLIVKGTLVSGLVFVIFLVGVIWGTWALTGSLLSGGWLMDILGFVARIGIVAAVIFLAPVLYAIVSGILMPIFRSQIFLRARLIEGGPEPAGGNVIDEVKIIGVEIRRLFRLLLFTVLLLPLHLIPGIGSLLYLALGLLLAGSAYGWDLLSYHFELHKMKYAEQKAWIKEHRGAVMSMGIVATLLCLIPFVQILFLNTNVAGAGLLSARLDKPI